MRSHLLPRALSRSSRCRSWSDDRSVFQCPSASSPSFSSFSFRSLLLGPTPPRFYSSSVRQVESIWSGLHVQRFSSTSSSLSSSSSSSSSKSLVPRSTQPLVFAGPSGSGKSTLISRLLQDYPNSFGFSVSHTTRSPRPGEIDGVHYHFVSHEEMRDMSSRGEFIETSVYSGNTYGTSKGAIREVARLNMICILDVNLQGIQTLKRLAEEESSTGNVEVLRCRYFFIVPPSIQSLRERLRLRGKTPESIERRTKAAELEMSFTSIPGFFDRIIINEDRDKAYADLEKAIQYL